MTRCSALFILDAHRLTLVPVLVPLDVEDQRLLT